MDRRSNCPISFALELFGDRWTLLLIRDIGLHAKHSFSQLRESEEGIATNILTERLVRLEERGIVRKQRDPADGRRYRYSLTDAGKDLIPILVDLVVWGAAQDPKSAAPAAFIREAKKNRAGLLERLRAQADA